MAILEPIKIHQNFERLKLIIQHKRELINLPPLSQVRGGLVPITYLQLHILHVPVRSQEPVI